MRKPKWLPVFLVPLYARLYARRVRVKFMDREGRGTLVVSSSMWNRRRPASVAWINPINGLMVHVPLRLFAAVADAPDWASIATLLVDQPLTGKVERTDGLPFTEGDWRDRRKDEDGHGPA